MTVSTTSTRVAYAGNGVASQFTVPFPFFGHDELEVIERDIGSGVDTIKSLGADYEVSGGNGQDGSVTATNAPATGKQWTIRRVTKAVQETDYEPNDPFPAETHEAALDRAMMVAQETNEIGDRSLQIPASDPDTINAIIPANTLRAGKLLGFDGSGNVTTYTPDNGILPSDLALDTLSVSQTVSFAGANLLLDDDQIDNSKISGMGLELLNIADINDIASVNYNQSLIGAYAAYYFVLCDVVPMNDGADLILRISYDNGSTIEIANYEYHRTKMSSTSINYAANAASGATGLNLAGMIGNDIGEGVSGIVSMFNPSSSNQYKQFSWDLAGVDLTGKTLMARGAGACLSATSPINYVSFLLTSGNLKSGRIKLYGAK